MIRFYQLESFAGFDFDQELAATIATKILNGKLTLIGQEISLGGIFVGPLYNYLLAILLFFSRGDPAILYSSQAILGIISTYLVYQVAKAFNPHSAPIAAILYTFSFRMVYIDKTAAPSNWLVFLTLLSLFILTRNTLKPITKLIASSSIAGFATQLHPAGIALLPLALSGLNKKPLLKSLSLVPIKLKFFTNPVSKKFELKNFFASGLSLFFFAIWFTPLLLFDLRHHFLNLTGLFASMGKAVDYPLIFRLFTRLSLTLDTWLTTLSFSHNLFVLLPTIILLPQFKKILIKKQNRLMLISLLSSPLIFTLYKGPVLDYYLLPSIVAFLIFLSPSLAQISSSNFLGRLLVTVWLTVFALTNLSTTLNFKNPFSLKAKKQIVNYIISNFPNPLETSQPGFPTRINLDTDLGQGNGFKYLFQWKQQHVGFQMTHPSYVIYIPASRGQGGIVFQGIRLASCSQQDC